MRENLLAILALGLGIGAAATLFSFVNPLLVHPLAYPRADRLMTIEERDPKGRATPATLESLRQWSPPPRAFHSIAAYDVGTFFLTGVSEPEQIYGALVTSNLFDVLGVHPMLGRGFGPDEPDAAVLTYGAWQRFFGGDPHIIGRAIDLDFARTPEVERYRVVGVMPRDFWMYYGGFEVFVPLNERALNAKANVLYAVARLAPNTSAAEAEATLTAPAKGWSVRVRPWAESLTTSIRRQVVVIASAAGLLLLVACASVAGLLLTRAFARRREAAIRAALGASSARLIRWSLGNSLKVALAAGVLGTALAYLGVLALLAFIPSEIVSRSFVPGLDRVAVNGPALLFALVAALGACLLCGVLPAWSTAHLDLYDGLRPISSVRSQHTRRALVAIEVALAVMLLAGAGLVGKTLDRIGTIDLGFRVDKLLTLRIPSQDRDRTRVLNQRRAMLARIGALPGVTSVALASAQPLTGTHGSVEIRLPGRDEPLTSGVMVVTPNYFSTLGFGLRAGRFLSDADTGRVLVNETLARRLWPNQNPVGQTVMLDGSEAPLEVIGVVADTRPSLLESPSPLLYRAFADNPAAAAQMAIRTAADPLALAKAVTAAVRESGGVVADVSPMKDLVGSQQWMERLAGILFAAFASIALILAAAAIYAAVSLAVSQRAKEIGIRVALGAPPVSIAALLVRESAAPVAAGILAGLGGALAVGRTIASLLYHVRPADPAILAGVAIVVLVASIAACLPPLRRALQIDPSSASRLD